MSINNDKELKLTDNLIINITKLCDGLRESGFNSYAKDIESNYILFNKEAKSKNTLEDLLEEAHKGSEIKYNDSIYGVVENLLKQHKMIMDVVNKNPTGKLANKDILNKLKVVLSQVTITDVHRKKSAYDTLKKCVNFLNSSKTNFAKISDINESVTSTYNQKCDEIINQINNLNHENIVLDSILLIIKQLNALKKYCIDIKQIPVNFISFELTAIQLYGDSFNPVLSNLDEALKTAATASEVLNGSYDDFLIDYYSKQKNNEQNNNKQIFDKYTSKINSLLKDLKSWKAKISSSDYDDEDIKYALSFIDNQFILKLNKINDYLNQMNDIGKLDEASKEIDKMLLDFINNEVFIRFESEWVEG